jgi:hypothetical protein
VPGCPQQTRPVVGRAAGLDPDQAGSETGEEPLDLGPPQPALENDAALCIDCMDLERALSIAREDVRLS